MSAIPVPIVVKENIGWSIVLSILMIVAGVLAIFLPSAAALGVNIVVGWLMIFSGAAHLVFAWHTRHNRGFIWEIILGILYAFVGGYVLVNPVAGLLSLALALAIYLFLEGVLEFALSFQIRPAPGSGWLMFDGIVTLILAFMVWRLWPSGAPWVIGTLVGISMLFSGVSRLMLSLVSRRVVAKLA